MLELLLNMMYYVVIKMLRWIKFNSFQMQVSRGNILISIGMLYNPNLTYDQIFGSQCKHYPYHSYTDIFPLPLYICT